MTACSSKLQHLSYVTEAAWAESSTSATGAVTIPITAMIDASQLGRKMIDPGRVTQFRNERPKMIPGTFDGVEFAIEFECVGHGSATSGTPTITAYESLLAWMVGASASIVAGTTIDNSVDGVQPQRRPIQRLRLRLPRASRREGRRSRRRPVGRVGLARDGSADPQDRAARRADWTPRPTWCIRR
jgi:hypothetical protein